MTTTTDTRSVTPGFWDWYRAGLNADVRDDVVAAMCDHDDADPGTPFWDWYSTTISDDDRASLLASMDKYDAFIADLHDATRADDFIFFLDHLSDAARKPVLAASAALKAATKAAA